MNYRIKSSGWPLLFLGLFVILLVMTWFFFTSVPQAKYETVRVEKKTIIKTVLASGVIKAIEQVDVGAQVSGQITYLGVEAGQNVKKGQLLAEIDPLLAQTKLKTAQTELASAQAKLEICQAKLKQASQDWHRKKLLHEKNVVSRAEIELSEANYLVADAELKGAKAALNNAFISVERARAELSYTRILAPMDGTVIHIAAAQGQTLAATQTVPMLLTIADLRKMTVEIKLSEADVTRVRVGMPVYFNLIGSPENIYQGSLRHIALAPTNITDTGKNTGGAVYYSASFDVLNPDNKLRVSMTAEVSVIIGQADNALTIPVAALKQKKISARHNEVEVLTDRGVISQRVEVGIYNDFDAEIKDGLSEGESIILTEKG